MNAAVKALVIRLSLEEWSLLRKNADENGVSMNRYVKTLISNSGRTSLVRRFVQSSRPVKSEQIEILEQATAQKVEGSPFPFRNQLERHLMKSIIQSLPSEVFKSRFVEPEVGIPASELLQMVIKVSPEFAGVTEGQLADYIREGCPSFEELAPGAFFSRVLFPAILAQ